MYRPVGETKWTQEIERLFQAEPEVKEFRFVPTLPPSAAKEMARSRGNHSKFLSYFETLRN
jgi:hypothetical protein